MFSRLTLSSFLLLLVVLAQLSTAHPAHRVSSPYGATLPSAEGRPSNITNTLMSRESATEPFCGASQDISLALVEDAKWCIDYLRKISNNVCSVRGYRDVSLFCQHNDAFVYGEGLNPDHPINEESICGDVALGAEWIVGHCTMDFSTFSGLHPHQEFRVGGAAPANGNGGILVVIKDKAGGVPFP